MYTSAMTLLERRDGQADASYLDLAQAIEDFGSRRHIEEDLHQLFRRAVFNVLIGNRDDHLRNHGLLRDTSGWRLSPAFDVNANPAKHEHNLTLDGKSAAPDVGRVLETSELYRLNAVQAQAILAEVRAGLSEWRQAARAQGIPNLEVTRMSAVIQA